MRLKINRLNGHETIELPDDLFIVEIGPITYELHQNPWDGKLMIRKISGEMPIQITPEAANKIGIK